MNRENESHETLVERLKRHVDVVDEILRLRRHLNGIDAKLDSIEDTVRSLEATVLDYGRHTPGLSPCEYARQRHQNLARWRNLWTILVFTFGIAVVAFLVAAILLFVRESWLPAALSTVGTIVSGVGIKWVLDRRSDAVKEEVEAYNDVGEKCGATTAADIVRQKAMLFMNFH